MSRICTVLLLVDWITFIIRKVCRHMKIQRQCLCKYGGLDICRDNNVLWQLVFMKCVDTFKYSGHQWWMLLSWLRAMLCLPCCLWPAISVKVRDVCDACWAYLSAATIKHSHKDSHMYVELSIGEKEKINAHLVDISVNAINMVPLFSEYKVISASLVTAC